jgi:thioredoxin 2
LTPVLEQLARALAGRAKLVRVDVENTPQLIQRFRVQALPTLLVMNRGRALARKSGAAQARDLGDWVEEALTGVENASTSNHPRASAG